MWTTTHYSFLVAQYHLQHDPNHKCESLIIFRFIRIKHFYVFIFLKFLLFVLSSAQKEKICSSLIPEHDVHFFYFLLLFQFFYNTELSALCCHNVSCCFTVNHQFQDSQNVRKTCFQSCTKKDSSAQT